MLPTSANRRADSASATPENRSSRPPRAVVRRPPWSRSSWMPVQPRPGRTPRPRRPAASVRRPPRWSRGGGCLGGTLGRTVRPLMSMGTAARLGAEGKLDRSAAEASTSRVADGASRVAAMPGVAKAFGGRLVSRARARAAELVTAAASRSPFAVSRFQRSLKMAMGRGPASTAAFFEKVAARRRSRSGRASSPSSSPPPSARRGRRCARRPGHRPGQRAPSREAGRCSSGAGDRCRARHPAS